MFILGPPSSIGNIDSNIAKQECAPRLFLLTHKLPYGEYYEFFERVETLYTCRDGIKTFENLTTFLIWAEEDKSPECKILTAAVVCEFATGMARRLDEGRFKDAFSNIAMAAVKLFNETIFPMKPKATMVACIALLAAKEIDTRITDIAFGLAQHPELLSKPRRAPMLHN